MADTIVIETPVATVLEVSGLQGPQGPTGPQGPSGEASGSLPWASITGKPSTFTPSAHTHTSADVTDFAAAVVAAAPPTTNASLLTSGTLADARLSAAVTTSLSKADTASQPGHTHTASAISDSTTTGRSVLTSTDAAAARTAIGAQASGSYAAATHSHAIGDVTGLQTSLDGKQASGSYAAASHTHAASDIASGTLDNARVNWAAPLALGSTTAAAATVTDLKADTLTMPKSGQPTILANVTSGNLSATGQISAATLTTASGGSVIVASGGALRLESGAAFVDPTDTTKKLALNLSGISASTTRTLSVQDVSGVVALTQQESDYEVTDATKGVIMKSPNGIRWRLTIDNNGALLRTALTLLLWAFLMCGAKAQVRDLVYNTNNVVIGPTNTNALAFTNSVAFSNALTFGTNAPTTRTNLGLGSLATNNSVPSFAAATNSLLTADGAGGSSFVANRITTVVKSADQSKTNTSDLTIVGNNDSELTVSVVAGTVYSIQARLQYTAPSTGGLNASIVTGTNNVFVNTGGPVGFAAREDLNARVFYISTASGGTVAGISWGGAGSSTGGTNLIWAATGVFRAENSGTLTLRWAQNTTNATPTTLKAGSSITLTKLN